MATLVKTYPFDADGNGFVFTTGVKSTGLWSSTGGNTGGCWLLDTLGRNNTDDSYLELTTTWEALGVPSGSTINSITASSYDWRCSVFYVGTLYGVGALEVHDNTPTLQATLSTELTGTGTTSYASRTGGTVSIPSAIQASSTTVRIRLWFHLDVGNDKNAQITILVDNISFTVDYTGAVTNHVLSLDDTASISDQSSFAADFQRTVTDTVQFTEQITTGIVQYYLATKSGYFVSFNGHYLKIKE